MIDSEFNLSGNFPAATIYQGSTVNYYGGVAPLPVDPAVLANALVTRARLPTETIPMAAALPTRSWMPFARNPLFVGREEDFKQLATSIKTSDTTPVVGATGLGGIGKTQLASEFAHRYGAVLRGWGLLAQFRQGR
jgi:hypothetical protein